MYFKLTQSLFQSAATVDITSLRLLRWPHQADFSPPGQPLTLHFTVCIAGSWRFTLL